MHRDSLEPSDLSRVSIRRHRYISHSRSKEVSLRAAVQAAAAIEENVKETNQQEHNLMRNLSFYREQLSEQKSTLRDISA